MDMEIRIDGDRCLIASGQGAQVQPRFAEWGVDSEYVIGAEGDESGAQCGAAVASVQEHEDGGVG